MVGKSVAKVSTNKRDGFRYEMEFFTRAIREELDVFIPAGDYLPQDCIVQNQEGKMFKVQIKGTRTHVKEKFKKIPRYRITCASGSGGKNPIDCEHVDILAGYILPLDLFYIIPCDKLTGVATWLYPNDPNTASPLEVYRENWDIFKNAA